MAGTKAGGMKTRATILEKYGRDYYAKAGALGGAAGKGHTFAHGRVDPSTAGKLGGRGKKAKSRTHFIEVRVAPTIFPVKVKKIHWLRRLFNGK